MRITKLIILSVLLSSMTPTTPTHNCTATWYDTSRHPKVHRDYSTAAFNHYPRGTKVLVTNVNNGKQDTVTITDRHVLGFNHIDLSKVSFGKLANIKEGRIKVIVKKLI